MALASYRAIFQNRSFRRFWLGFSFSVLGDSMTRVALTWFVYEATHSAAALGWLMLCYTGPIVVGGLLAGSLLDWFDRRMVMMADNLIRGIAVASIPLLNAWGLLELWHVYTVAAIYGALMMISLAGGPALIPLLVEPSQLATANALEMISFTLGGVVGPVIAGVLIGMIGAPNVVCIDAFSYLVFALVLVRLTLRVEQDRPANTQKPVYHTGHVVQLLFQNRILLSTTLMFMAFNIGGGTVGVWLPILADQIPGGGASLFGVLLGMLAAGEVISSVLAGGRMMRLPLGTMICLAQILSGVAIGLLLLNRSLWALIAALILFGACSAPLTIWAQTLRMQIIPEQLRGRTFALLRTLMQSGNPIGGAAAGALLPILGIPMIVGLAALIITIPGMLGYQVKELREASNSTKA